MYNVMYSSDVLNQSLSQTSENQLFSLKPYDEGRLIELIHILGMNSQRITLAFR